jgi:hypothetical protein
MSVEIAVTAAPPPWSIGIYHGGSLFDFAPLPFVANPVIVPSMVTDLAAELVADPFMIRRGGMWHLFFEAFDPKTRRGEIALATSEDGLCWTYQQIVLAEPFHLSYPYVFESDGDVFMVAETLGAGAVMLYRAESFPLRWKPEARLVTGTHADPSIVRHDDKWWLFTCPNPRLNDTLRLYVADALTGPWREHPRSPIVSGDKRIARPGGRVVAGDGRLVRYAQDCKDHYGHQVHAFEILRLNEREYVEEEWRGGPILTASGSGWNRTGMHTIDPHPADGGGWIACVDGQCW